MNKRAFVIGNGPSLRPSDLDLLAGEISYGVNHVHLIYPETVWRPTYWVCVDIPDVDRAAWHSRQGYKCYVTADRADKVEKKRHPIRSEENISYVATCVHLRQKANGDCPLEFHLPSICSYGGGGITALQLAILSGYDEIYLLGHDLGLKGGDHETDLDHFHPQYNIINPMSKGYASVMNVTLHHAHSMVRDAAREAGTTIYNATRGGELETYPRVDFSSLFNG